MEVDALQMGSEEGSRPLDAVTPSAGHNGVQMTTGLQQAQHDKALFAERPRDYPHLVKGGTLSGFRFDGRGL